MLPRCNAKPGVTAVGPDDTIILCIRNTLKLALQPPNTPHLCRAQYSVSEAHLPRLRHRHEAFFNRRRPSMDCSRLWPDYVQ